MAWVKSRPIFTAKSGMQHYRNIIFDFGGVIIDIDYKAPIRAFAEITGQDFAGLYDKSGQQQVFDLLEKGQIGPGEFRKQVKQLLGMPAMADQVFDEAWNSILGTVPAERVEFLKEIGKAKRIFLLSNTNVIHANAFLAQFERQYGITLQSLFEHAYLSHEMGDRKPHGSAFETVLANHDLNKEETLFIDDSIQHIEGARSIGLPAHHLIAPETILDLGLI
jgi:putative hydrolase of the HAD superfamily